MGFGDIRRIVYNIHACIYFQSTNNSTLFFEFRSFMIVPEYQYSSLELEKILTN